MQEEDLRIDASWHSDIAEGAAKDAAAVKAFDEAVKQNERQLKRNDDELKKITKQLDDNAEAWARGKMSAAEYTAELTRLRTEQFRLRREQERLTKEIHKGRHAMRGYNQEVSKTNRLTRAAGGAFRALGRIIGGDDRQGGHIYRGVMRLVSGFGKLAGVFGSILKMGVRGLIPVAIVAGIPFILRGIAALSGGLGALIAKWSQASGVFLAAPAALATAAAGFGTLLLAIKGLDEKSKKFFADWGKGLQKVATKAVFSPATLKSMREMTEALDPTLKGGLSRIGRIWGRVIRSISSEIRRGKTQGLLQEILGTAPSSNGMLRNAGAAQIIGQLSKAAVPGLRLLLQLTRAGMPVLKQMANDMARFFGSFSFDSDKATNFMARAYTTLQEFGRTVRNLWKGLVNIGKLVTGAGGSLTRSLEVMSMRFLDWTTSPKGMKSIGEFFSTFGPALREIGKWIPAISNALKSITMTNGDFITVSEWLRTKALPAITTAWTYLKDHFVPVLDAVWGSMQEIAGSGAGKAIQGGFIIAVKGITALMKAIGQLPGGPVLLAAAGAFVAFRVLLGSLGLGRVPGPLIATAMNRGGAGGMISSAASMTVGTIYTQAIVTGANAAPGGAAATGKTKGGKHARGTPVIGPYPGGKGALQMGKLMKGTVALTLIMSALEVFENSYTAEKNGELQKYLTEMLPSQWLNPFEGMHNGFMAMVDDFKANGDVISAMGALLSGVSPFRYTPSAQSGNSPVRTVMTKAEYEQMLRDRYSQSEAGRAAEGQAALNRSGYSKNKNYLKYFTEEGVARERPLTDKELNQLKTLRWQAKHAKERGQKELDRMMYGTAAQRRADRAAHGIGEDPEGIAYWRQKRRATFFQELQNGTWGGADGRRGGAGTTTALSALEESVNGPKRRLDAFKSTLDELTTAPHPIEMQLSLLMDPASRMVLSRWLGIQVWDDPQPPRPGSTGGSTLPGSGKPTSTIPRWTGGLTLDKQYLVGEKGPEIWMSRTGQMFPVGVHGPEVLQLGPGAVINAEASRDPFTGRPGLTPQWALEALQKTATAPLRAASEQQGGIPYTKEVHMSFGDIHTGATAWELEQAALRALRKADRERAERR